MCEFQAITEENRAQCLALLKALWHGRIVVVRGECVELSSLDGLCACDGGEIAGLITYRILEKTCEIVSLNSLKEKRGIGSALVERVADLARAAGCQRLVLITTNDNIDALRFYQKRGFDLLRLYRNALEETRRLKPGVPPVGEHGIPLRHEIELERFL